MRSSTKIRTKVLSLGLAGGLLLAAFGAVAPAAEAAVMPAGRGFAPCGFSYWYPSGNVRMASYNNCSSQNIKVQVDYDFGNAQKCIPHGVTDFPDGFANRVNNVFKIGSC